MKNELRRIYLDQFITKEEALEQFQQNDEKEYDDYDEDEIQGVSHSGSKKG